MVFQSLDGGSTVVFTEDAAGNVEYLLVGTGAYQKVKWYESQPFQLGLVGYFLLIFLSGIVVALSWRTGPTLFRWILGGTAFLNLAFLVGMAIVLLRLDPWEFIYGLPPLVVLLLTIPLVMSVLLLLLLPLGGQIVLAGEWSPLARAYTLVICLTAIGFPIFLNFWRLLGYRV